MKPILVALLLVVAFACEKPPGLPSNIVDHDVLYFESNRGGRDAIWRVGLDGTGLRQVTPDTITRSEGCPSLSPDGSWIAFASIDNGVWKMTKDGANRTLLDIKGGSAGGVFWSSIGNEIIFTNQCLCCEGILGVSPDGTGERTIVGSLSYQPIGSPAVSSTGKIVFVRESSCSITSGILFVVNTDGTGLKSIPTQSYGPISCNWSHDGSKIVFESYRYPTLTYEIHTINADGTNEQRLTVGPTDGYPSFSPDGNQIVYTARSDSGKGTNVWIMNSNGSGGKKITTGEFGDIKPIWVRY